MLTHNSKKKKNVIGLHPNLRNQDYKGIPQSVKFGKDLNIKQGRARM